jgi:hypothetical protein
MSFVKVLSILAILVLLLSAFLYSFYGTLSPCGMLREKIRRQDKIASLLPDSLVDGALEIKYGRLTPGRCVAVLLQGGDMPTAQEIVTPMQQSIEHFLGTQTPLPPQTDDK